MFDSCKVPEPGCCGMAGPFGFDAHKYDVSLEIIISEAPATRVRCPDAETGLALIRID